MAATPIPPAITNVAISPTYAFISWRSGYNGGLRQTIEIWYRHTNSDDYHWRSITRISSHATSYTIDGIEPRLPYLFSLRGVNDAGFGLFSDIFYAGTVTLSSDDQEEDTKGEDSHLIGIPCLHMKSHPIIGRHFALVHLVGMFGILSSLVRVKPAHRYFFLYLSFSGPPNFS